MTGNELVLRMRENYRHSRLPRFTKFERALFFVVLGMSVGLVWLAVVRLHTQHPLVPYDRLGLKQLIEQTNGH